MDCDCAGREAVTGRGRRFSRSSAYANKPWQTPEDVYHSSIMSPREVLQGESKRTFVHVAK